jgi:hypothetical protein
VEELRAFWDQVSAAQPLDFFGFAQHWRRGDRGRGFLNRLHAGPGALAPAPHALAPVADLPVIEVVSSLHMLCDLTLGLGSMTFNRPGARRQLGL